ncbi:hypothetical protein [Quadrisphaera sp. DSM 44207]|uniref:AraC-like ligand-binding domain-containing protein n=1 Tax=Quadrisphaera sp. DSM 44207 TaxID=1881057 RepID=UPI0015A0B819
MIARTYADNRFDLGRPDADFELRLDSVSAGALTSARLHYGVQGRVRTAPADTFITALVLSGSASFARPGSDRRSSPPVGSGATTPKRTCTPPSTPTRRSGPSRCPRPRSPRPPAPTTSRRPAAHEPPRCASGTTSPSTRAPSGTGPG